MGRCNTIDDKSELKVKTPGWRTSELTNLVRKLDERKSEKGRSNAQTPLRKQRIAADSPMKRKPSGRVPAEFINFEEYDEDDDGDDGDQPLETHNKRLRPLESDSEESVI